MGNLDPLATNTITLSIANNPNNGSLVGLTSLPASSGVASFNNVLLLDSIGNGYTLEASASGLTSDTTDAFNVIPAASVPDHYEFLVQPSNTSPGGIMFPNIQVRVLDSANNLVLTNNEHISLTIANNPNNGTLSGTDSLDLAGDEDYITILNSVSVTSINGISTFTDISIDSAGMGYTLMAQSGDTSIGTAVSNAFDITPTPGVPTQLAFSIQPSNEAFDVVITPTVIVTVLDGNGNVVADANDTVTVSIGNNPNEGSLSGTVTDLLLVNGGAAFNDLSIDSVGSGYTLIATANGLTSAVSEPFDIIDPEVVTALDFWWATFSNGGRRYH